MKISMRKTIAFICALTVAVLCSCGKNAEKSGAKSADSSGSETSVTTTTSAPKEIQPKKTVTAGSPSEGRNDKVKDDIKHLFGYETDEEKYLKTMTTTTQTTTTTNKEQYEKQLREAYTLTIDDNLVVTRTSGIYEDSNIGWKITYNGDVMLERNAENEMTFKYDWCGAGKYTMTLTAFVDGEYRPVSNTVEYTVDAEYSSRQQEKLTNDSDVMDAKDTLKHIIKSMNFDGGVKYKYYMGYVCDADHDGETDAVPFYLFDGIDRELQLIMFDGAMYSNTHTPRTQYSIWYDKGTQKDYICCIVTEKDDITVSDAVTDEVLWEKKNGTYTLFGRQVSEAEFDSYGFYENSLAPKLEEGNDNDHVYVSRDHTAQLESVY